MSCILPYHPGVLTVAQQQLLKPHPERLNFWLSLVSINRHVKRDIRQIWRRSPSWLWPSRWGEASINPVHFLHVKRSAAEFLFRLSAADLPVCFADKTCPCLNLHLLLSWGKKGKKEQSSVVTLLVWQNDAFIVLSECVSRLLALAQTDPSLSNCLLPMTKLQWGFGFLDHRDLFPSFFTSPAGARSGTFGYRRY